MRRQATTSTTKPGLKALTEAKASQAKEVEEQLKGYATIEQANETSAWVKEHEELLENVVKPITDAQSKDLTNIHQRLDKIEKEPAQVSSGSPVKALQIRLASLIAAGSEAAMGDIRETLLSASALLADEPELSAPP